ncbi:MAG TPA: hypothetical protein VF572_00065 [Candidatus Saccharimonadales bacterium]|jgi:hypothetical protein
MQYKQNDQNTTAQPADAPAGAAAVRPEGLGRVLPKRILFSIAAILTSVAYFSLTTPRSVQSVLLIVGFILLGLTLYGILTIILTVTGLHGRLSVRNRRSILITGTVFPVLLLMLQSIGQLTVRDILTLSGVFLIGIFYTGRMRRR